MATLTKTPPRRMTFEEYVAWAPENRKTEWVDGEVIEFMSTLTRHAEVESFLLGLVMFFVNLRALGQVFSGTYAMRVRGGRSSREPDVVFIANQNLGRITRERLEGPADLVVEIVSEDSVTRDRRDKFREYAEVGVPEYWIVEGRDGFQGFDAYEWIEPGKYRRIEPDAAGLIRSRVLPGLAIDPAWLAADPPPNPVDALRQVVPGVL
jgi:Uma2 family endonuclease